MQAAPATPQPLPPLPKLKQPSDMLFWTPAQRVQAFRRMESLGPHAMVDPSERPRVLPEGPPLSLGADIDLTAWMQRYHAAGLLVLHRGQIRMERYGLDLSAQESWASFSMAKSVTSTLVGVAIQRGLIKGVDEPIVTYLPELSGSAYEGVTVGQLLSMTSGAAWDEDYEDPESDLAKFFSERAVPEGVDPTLAYMRTLRRAAPPGERWHYSTGETALVGVLLRRAVGGSLAALLSESIWAAWGMEAQAGWFIDKAGQEAGGCCMTARLRDWGRLGLFVLADGLIDGQRVVPEGWFEQATRAHADLDMGMGYGYQWWTHDDRSFEAIGIFGQLLHIDPARSLVVVILSAWPEATGAEAMVMQQGLIKTIKRALDEEGRAEEGRSKKKR